MKDYNHLKIEKKWQTIWEKKKAFVAKNKGKKFYGLIEFPYPSGDGLHIGHIRSNTAMDIIARKRGMEGFNVLYPIGWDAFGLPTENYAIKTGIQPAVVTKNNTKKFREQLKRTGVSFDWSREVNTSDPKYYKWTQWIFLQMFKKGLAYKKKMAINWCPKDKIGLANEEVVDGKCERCGTVVEKREKEQWMLAITKYADRLDKDLDLVDFLPKIKTQQRNWIGRSEGAELGFRVEGLGSSEEIIKVFTTRPDTLFGVTYVVLAPEHELVEKLKNQIKNWTEVEEYVEKSKKIGQIDRTNAEREKTGVKLDGIVGINPVNKEEVPIFIADYVLADYGTGAVMAVPAHDDRDFAFAKKYNLPVKYVILPHRPDLKNPHIQGKKTVFREGIMAIIHNPKNGKYLCLKWKKQPWTTFVMGGVEENEDPIAAAKREILEETGYKHTKLTRVLSGPIQTEFFAAHKDINRIAHTWPILFELIDEEKDELSAEESQIHDLIWLNLNEINVGIHTMTHAEIDIVLNSLNSGEKVWTESGILRESGKFNGKKSEEIQKEITEFAGGKWVETFKLRDWVFSRQRYWGEPIPIVNCPDCGLVPMSEKDLPLVLPKVKNYKPTDSGESPLAEVTKWVNTKCPSCGGNAKRETDTMPNWAGSSWYYLRYIDPKNSQKFVDPKKLAFWSDISTNLNPKPSTLNPGPVDWYNGGMEHTTLHLLYSRFWHKFLYDIKMVPTPEPYKKRTSHGMILAEGGEKMSKSRGNVINPDDIIKVYGADTLRVYEMFMGPFDQAISWDTNSISGSRRFIERVWRLQSKVNKKIENGKIENLLHKTIQKVSEDIESMRFNTAISSMMILVNDLEKSENISRENYEKLILILSPFAPHICEELWQIIGNKKPIFSQKWPKADSKKMIQNEVNLIIQVNGKVRSQVIVSSGLSQDEVVIIAQKLPDVDKWLMNKKIVKIIHIPNKLLNFVVA